MAVGPGARIRNCRRRAPLGPVFIGREALRRDGPKGGAGYCIVHVPHANRVMVSFVNRSRLRPVDARIYFSVGGVLRKWLWVRCGDDGSVYFGGFPNQSGRRDSVAQTIRVQPAPVRALVAALREAGIDPEGQPARYSFHPSGVLNVRSAGDSPMRTYRADVDLATGPYWQLGAFSNKYPEMYPLASGRPNHWDLVVDVTALSCLCFATTPFFRRSGADPHEAWGEWRSRCEFMEVHATPCPVLTPDVDLGVVVYTMPSIRKNGIPAAEIAAVNVTRIGDTAWSWLS